MGEPITMEAAGVPYAKRFIQGGKIVGFAVQMANGWWALSDNGEKRLPGPLYTTAKRARAAFAALQAEGEKTP